MNIYRRFIGRVPVAVLAVMLMPYGARAQTTQDPDQAALTQARQDFDNFQFGVCSDGCSDDEGRANDLENRIVYLSQVEANLAKAGIKFDDSGLSPNKKLSELKHDTAVKVAQMYVDSISKNFNAIKLKPTSNLGMDAEISYLKNAMAYGGLTLTDLKIPTDLDFSREGQIALSQGAAWSNAYAYLEHIQTYLEHNLNGHLGGYSADEALNSLHFFNEYLRKSDQNLDDTGMTLEDLENLRDYLRVTGEIGNTLYGGQSDKEIISSISNILNGEKRNNAPENFEQANLQSFQKSMLQAINSGKSLSSIETLYRVFALDSAKIFIYLLSNATESSYLRNAPWNNIGRHPNPYDGYNSPTPNI